MVKKVFVVPHTHWDREWFFTSDQAKVYLLKDLKDVLDHLEASGQYGSFLLDGQSSLIEDYLNWRPQERNRVEKLVKEKKLILGPWYTQTDQYLASGESIINNLRIGMKQSDELGGHMNIAYVPDSFGQESSMPQIYQQLGIDDAVLYRGFSLDDTKQSEFTWQGEDGSEISVFRMACGYFIGGVVDETKLAQLMTEEPFKTVVDQASTDNVLFPNGSDMAPLRFDLPEFIERLNQANKGKFTFEVASLEDYITAVKEAKPELRLITGEQDCGKDMRVHKSISSSRADLKALNTKLQNYLANVVEPVLALGSYFGLPYPTKTLEDLWKKMAKNAAHDSMGNCVSDRVNADIKARYQKVEDIATALVEVTLRQISTGVKNDGHPITLTVFNTLPVERGGVVSKRIYSPSRNFKIQDYNGQNIPFEITAVKDVTELITSSTIQLDPGQAIYLPEKVYQLDVNMQLANIPAFGYKQLSLVSEQDQEIDLPTRQTGTKIENEFYQISVNVDGSLDILDKLNNHLYQKQAILEENGDDGDSYNYSPAKQDLVSYSTAQPHRSQCIQNALSNKLIIDYDFSVPSDLAARAKGLTDVKMPTQMIVTLDRASKLIKFELNVDNRLPKSHRLCIDFDSEVVTNTSIADIQFGTIKRPLTKKQALRDWHQNQGAWQEKPISINTVQGFVAMSDDERGLALIPQGVREYECIGKDKATIRLTVFRTYGMLGKRDLLYRPGRASGDETVPTPEAELNQHLSFELAMTTMQNCYDQAALASEIKAFETPLQVYQYAEFLNGRLTFPFNPVKRTADPELSLFKTDDKLVISTVEQIEEGTGYQMRLYNPLFHPVGDKITFNKQPQVVQLVDLLGNKIADLQVDNRTVVLPEIDHAKFMTVYFEL
ncbi:glycoside hydrolase family 38 C-terminal domain-containing protein [Lactobacillus sp. M0390]|uniref:glycoside hydrolase family 38 N-terminal domain-containing protein n=1 Tax=Lactobacillus sp. M0390 TaxID=2751026 RepID=UPI0018DD0E80|nr:glycoside hydrolase family 38 C-terminal domain-containing protein [Lactobacillus sp. M0390]MBH9985741.1 alpha-mannosidase [Lactobacillus sp. M0390]